MTEPYHAEQERIGQGLKDAHNGFVEPDFDNEEQF